jgi:serine protease Do
MTLRSLIAVCAVLALASPSAHAQITRPLVDYSDIVAKVKPAVVSVTAHKMPVSLSERFPDLYERFGGERALERGGEVALTQDQGTAFVFDAAKGQLVTVAYLIERAQRVDVRLPNGETREAKVIGRDDVSGVALLQVTPGGLVNLNWAAKPPQAGQPALLIGNAHGLGISVTAGMVANPHIDLRGQTEQMMLLDMAVMKGAGGGPVVDSTGAVIGMAAAQYGSSVSAYENLGLAYDAAEVRRIATILARDGRVERGKIGVRIEEDWLREVRIAEVTTGSPADKAGLKPGDVVLKIAGEKVTSRAMLTNVVGIQPIGAPVVLTIRRGGETKDVSVVVAANLNE